LFKTISGYSAKTNYWYTALMGGIQGTSSAGVVITECTDKGTYTAEAKSLTGTAGGRATCLGGMVGNGTPKLTDCISQGTYTVDAACGAYKGGTNFLDESLNIGGLVGRLGGSFATAGTMNSITKSSAPYIASGCTVKVTINAPGYKYVGLAIGSDYARFASVATTPNAATDFPVMGCEIGGTITKVNVDAVATTAENFHNYIYGDIPAVATWTATETLYHGNTFNAQ
jgi:hypothetical protein